MAKDAAEKSWEKLLSLSAEGLKKDLARALEEAREDGAGAILRDHPDFLARLLGSLKRAGAAEVLSQAPGAADQLAELLWEGVASQTGRAEALRSLLEKAERPMQVNLEASDSPFQGHFIVKGGEIGGGAGLLHFRDEDFRLMGPTEVLFDLLTGDLPMGFSNLRLQTAGHSGWVSRLAPVLREVARLLKGGREEAGKAGAGM